MTLEEQLAYIRKNMPEAWAYLHDSKSEPPKFDDNDDVIHYWGGTLPAKEEN